MKPVIYILGCGGTIAGRASSADELIGYQAGEVSVEDLIQSVPQLAQTAALRGEQFCNIDSSDLTEELLTGLSVRVQELAAREDIDGIVITHGTDTMEESAYFLNLTVHTHKPIVITGAMRPSTAISADGPLNLLDAVRLAGCSEAGDYGVLQVMNGSICAARFVEKMDTAHVQAFADGQLGYLGFMQDGVPVFYQSPLRRHTDQSDWDCLSVHHLPAVWILYCHSGMDPAQVTAAAEHGVQGLVLAGLGHGNLPQYIMPCIQQALRQNIVVVRATRAAGIVSPAAKWPGMVAADNLSPQKARILLQLALERTQDPVVIQRYFDQY